jgi:hypothetical protein
MNEMYLLHPFVEVVVAVLIRIVMIIFDNYGNSSERSEAPIFANGVTYKKRPPLNRKRSVTNIYLLIHKFDTELPQPLPLLHVLWD